MAGTKILSMSVEHLHFLDSLNFCTYESQKHAQIIRHHIQEGVLLPIL